MLKQKKMKKREYVKPSITVYEIECMPILTSLSGNHQKGKVILNEDDQDYDFNADTFNAQK